MHLLKPAKTEHPCTGARAAVTGAVSFSKNDDQDRHAIRFRHCRILMRKRTSSSDARSSVTLPEFQGFPKPLQLSAKSRILHSAAGFLGKDCRASDRDGDGHRRGMTFALNHSTGVVACRSSTVTPVAPSCRNSTAPAKFLLHSAINAPPSVAFPRPACPPVRDRRSGFAP